MRAVKMHTESQMAYRLKNHDNVIKQKQGKNKNE